MAKKQRKFADDGWAVWVDGDDTSTVYINDWLNPKGKNYIDLAIRIRGALSGKLSRLKVFFKSLRMSVQAWLKRRHKRLPAQKNRRRKREKSLKHLKMFYWVNPLAGF